MKKLVAIVWKDVLVKVSSPMEWRFFLVLPLVFTMVIAAGTGTADSRVRLLITDLANTAVSRALVSELEAAGGFRVDELALDRAQAELSARRAPALLLIPRQTGAAAVDGGAMEIELRARPNDTGAPAAERAVRRAADKVGRAVLAARAGSTDLPAALAQGDPALPLVVTARALTPDAVRYDARANSSAGQLITWVFIPLLAISSLFVSERR